MPPTVYRIHTPHLIMRCWEPADAPQLMAAKNASKEHLLPWMPWALGEPSDLTANLALIRAWHAQFDTDQDLYMASSIELTQTWWAAQGYMNVGGTNGVAGSGAVTNDYGRVGSYSGGAIARAGGTVSLKNSILAH